MRFYQLRNVAREAFRNRWQLLMLERPPIRQRRRPEQCDAFGDIGRDDDCAFDFLALARLQIAVDVRHEQDVVHSQAPWSLLLLITRASHAFLFFAEQGPDGLPGPREAAHDGPDRDSQGLRRFLIAEALDRYQQHHHALRVG